MENNDTLLSDIKPEATRASFMQTLFCRLIDFVLDILILVLLFRLVPRDLLSFAANQNSFIMLVIFIAAITMYRFIFLLLFNKTVGMMVCSIKFLNGALNPLSPKEKFISMFRSRFSEIKYYKEN